MVRSLFIYTETLRRLLDDPTAELMRYRLKLSFMSVVVLHEDPPATPGDRLDVGQTSAEKLKSLSEAYYGRVEGIVTSGMAVELSDLRRQFSQACRHDHIRWEHSVKLRNSPYSQIFQNEAATAKQLLIKPDRVSCTNYFMSIHYFRCSVQMIRIVKLDKKESLKNTLCPRCWG